MKKLATGLVGLATLLLILSGCTKKPEPSKTDSSTEKVKTSQSSTSPSKTKVTLTDKELVAATYVESYMAQHSIKDIPTALNDILKQPQFKIDDTGGMFLANQEPVLVNGYLGITSTITDDKIHVQSYNGNEHISDKDYSTKELTSKYSTHVDLLKNIVALSDENTIRLNIDHVLQTYNTVGTDADLGGGLANLSATRSQFTKNGSDWTWKLMDSNGNTTESADVINVTDSSDDVNELTMKDADTQKTFTLNLKRKCDWVYGLTGSTLKNDINVTYVQEKTEAQKQQEEERLKQERSDIWDDFRKDHDTSKYTLYDKDTDFYTSGRDSFYMVEDATGNKQYLYTVDSDGTIELNGLGY